MFTKNKIIVPILIFATILLSACSSGVVSPQNETEQTTDQLPDSNMLTNAESTEETPNLKAEEELNSENNTNSEVETIEKESTMSDKTSPFAKYATYELPISLQIDSPIEDIGDYYIAKGNVTINYSIDGITFIDKLKTGENFTLLDKQFTKGEPFNSEGFSLHNYTVYCIDDDCAYYVCENMIENAGSRFNKRYYTLCYELPDPDFMMETMQPFGMIFEEQTIKINKDAFLTSSSKFTPEVAMQEYDPSKTEMEIFNDYEKQRKSSLKIHANTIEECIKGKLFLDDWWDISTNSSIYGEADGISPIFYVTFDENGVIDTMIMDSFS